MKKKYLPADFSFLFPSVQKVCVLQSRAGWICFGVMLGVGCASMVSSQVFGGDSETQKLADPATPGAKAELTSTQAREPKKKKSLSLVPPSFKRTDPLPYVNVPEPPKPDAKTQGRFMDPNMDNLHPGRPAQNFNPGNSQVYPGNFLPK